MLQFVKRTQEPKRVNSDAPVIYLDWNIFVGTRNGQMSDLEQLLRSAVGAGRLVVPFSADHVGELKVREADATPSTSPRLKEELDWLGRFTKSVYLYDAVNVPCPELRRETPVVVWHTLNDVPGADAATDAVLGMIPGEFVEPFRDELKAHPKELNNIVSSSVIAQVDSLFERRHAEEPSPGPPPTFRSLLGYARSRHPQGEWFGFTNTFAAAFALLNWVGFQPDKDFAATKRRAALADSQHAALAACTDLFVTEDRRLRIKAMTVFGYFGSSVPVTDGNGAIAWLTNRS